MAEIITILKRDTVEIILDKTETKEIFKVNIADSEYNERGFEEFLLYFKNTWTVISATTEIFTLFINLGTTKHTNELPLPAYIKLLKTISDLNDKIKNNCHCICILTEGSEKWQNAYNLLIKLWDPNNSRPILFSDSKEEIDKFILINKLIK